MCLFNIFTFISRASFYTTSVNVAVLSQTCRTVKFCRNYEISVLESESPACNGPFQLSRCLGAQEVWLLTNDDKVQNVGSVQYSMVWGLSGHFV